MVQPSVQQKMTILEDDLRNKNEPKNEDNLKFLDDLKSDSKPKVLWPIFYICDTNINKKPEFLTLWPILWSQLALRKCQTFLEIQQNIYFVYNFLILLLFKLFSQNSM